MRLMIDFEFPSRDWWQGGGQQLWEGIAETPDAPKVVVDDDLAASWLAQAERIAGWDAGPEYAPHPVRAIPLAEDDEDL